MPGRDAPSLLPWAVWTTSLRALGLHFLTLVEDAAVLTPGELLRAGGCTGCLSLSVTRREDVLMVQG